MANGMIKFLGGPFLSICVTLSGFSGLTFAALGEEFRKKYALEFLVLNLHWVVIIYLVWLCFHLTKLSRSLPKVKSKLDSGRLLLVEPKDWMGIDVGVLIFLKEQDYERIICHGYIANIQVNGLVQIAVLEPDIESRIGMQDNAAALIMKSETSSLMVKPGRARQS
jgi:hypothetical protein